MPTRIITDPILNSPFAVPERHHKFDDDGITDEVVLARRKSAYFVPIPKARSKGATQQTDWTEDRVTENEFVNQIRARVALWRDQGRPLHAALRRRGLGCAGLLVKRDVAERLLEQDQKRPEAERAGSMSPPGRAGTSETGAGGTKVIDQPAPTSRKLTRSRGTYAVTDPTRLATDTGKIVQHLAALPDADVRITLEIAAEMPAARRRRSSASSPRTAGR